MHFTNLFCQLSEVTNKLNHKYIKISYYSEHVYGNKFSYILASCAFCTFVCKKGSAPLIHFHLSFKMVHYDISLPGTHAYFFF